MSAILWPESLRAEYVASLTEGLRLRHPPGGSVTAWLSVLSTEALACALLHPRAQWRAVLFAAVGRARVALYDAPPALAYAGPLETIAHGPHARAALIAWATCRLAQEQIRLGLARAAHDSLVAATRRIHEWPTPLARHFEPRIEALYAEAVALSDRQRADEVA